MITIHLSVGLQLDFFAMEDLVWTEASSYPIDTVVVTVVIVIFLKLVIIPTCTQYYNTIHMNIATAGDLK